MHLASQVAQGAALKVRTFAGVAVRLFLLGWLAACGPVQAAASPPVRGSLTLTLMVTGDTWGYIGPVPEPCGCGPSFGGVTRRATRLALERQQSNSLLTVDAGNSLVGDSDPALKTKGASSVDAMNRMHYDAMALGPQDLALGPDVIRARAREAKFAIVSANLSLADGEGGLVKRYIIRPMAGHQVALIGLSAPENVQGMTVSDPVTAVARAVAEVAPKADIVVLLSHAGRGVDELIANEVAGVDAIVSGGDSASFDLWRSQRTGVPILHADRASPGQAGRRVGRALLSFGSQGSLTDVQWQTELLGDEVPDQPDMLAWVLSLAQ